MKQEINEKPSREVERRKSDLHNYFRLKKERRNGKGLQTRLGGHKLDSSNRETENKFLKIYILVKYNLKIWLKNNIYLRYFIKLTKKAFDFPSFMVDIWQTLLVLFYFILLNFLFNVRNNLKIFN